MRYRLIDTALGALGLGWTAAGIARLRLPGLSPAELRQGFCAAGAIEDAEGEAGLAGRIVAYADGRPGAFDDIAFDLAGVPELHVRIYGELRRIGWGETTTYGEIARRLGDVGLSRAVGTAMGRNPVPLLIPCHRVLAAGGRSGGFSAPGGVSAKFRLLALEKAAAPDGQFSLGL